MRILIPLIVVLIVIGLFLILQSAFIVNEYQQALVFQFGEIVRVVEEPGLKWKTPFIQNIRYYEKRVLEYDSSPRDVITTDKKTLTIDNFARWRIVDPETFYNTVLDENGAQARLDDIIYSELRAEIGRAEIIEVIRTKPTETMETNRREIMDAVTRTCKEKAQQYGIEVLDVRIKRADLVKENEQSVFNRMIAERKRIADRFRAEGKEEAFKIEANADKEKALIEAEANRQATLLRGEGEAEAIAIFAKALEEDPKFYRFLRTLEAYENTMQSNSTLVLSTDSEFFRYFSDYSTEIGSTE